MRISRAKDEFYVAFRVATFQVEVLLSICRFVVNVCGDLAIFVFNDDVKKMVVLQSCLPRGIFIFGVKVLQ